MFRTEIIRCCGAGVVPLKICLLYPKPQAGKFLENEKELICSQCADVCTLNQGLSALTR